jgi:hypothetical protein
VPYSYKFLQNPHTKKLATWKTRTNLEKEIRDKTSSMAINGKQNREREREEQEQEQERLEIGRRKWIGMENHITRDCNSNKKQHTQNQKDRRAGERASARERRGETMKKKKKKKRARGRGKRCFRKKPQRQSACRRSQCCGVLRVACEIAQVREMAC